MIPLFYEDKKGKSKCSPVDVIDAKEGDLLVYYNNSLLPSKEDFVNILSCLNAHDLTLEKIEPYSFMITNKNEPRT